MEEQPEPFTLEGDPSVISNEQTTVFVNQAPVLPVQKTRQQRLSDGLYLFGPDLAF